MGKDDNEPKSKDEYRKLLVLFLVLFVLYLVESIDNYWYNDEPVLLTSVVIYPVLIALVIYFLWKDRSGSQ